MARATVSGSETARESTLLRGVRFRLTAWYVVTLTLMLLLLGGGLYAAISHQIGADLTLSLRAATDQLERAARIREVEAGAPGRVVDAVEELRIPERALYLMDSTGAPVTPRVADQWILDAAARAAHDGVADVRLPTRRDDALQLHARRFTLPSQRVFVAVAVANTVELEDRYSALITLFGIAGATAVLLIAGGGWLLVRQSMAPVERSMVQMRRFMADAAHELRTPITVLRTQAEVALQRGRTSDEYVASLRSIDAESRRLGRIVDDLLTLARADSGEQARAFTRVFFDDTAMEAAGAAAAMAAARGVQLSLGSCDEAPVYGDGELLRQLVMILLDNAIKFSEPGSVVTVAVGVHGASARLTVSDDGPGIPPDQLSHVFERFYRGDPARGRGEVAGATSGSGLGLAIAQWISDLHHGRITIDSQPGIRTTATVDIPTVMPPQV